MSSMQEALAEGNYYTHHPDRTIALSGAFNVIHPGYTRMIQGALNFGKVVIILNSDEWVRRHKRVLMMPWQDRREVLLSIRGVAAVEPVDDSDGTVCEALRRLRPHVFGNGGFRTKQQTPESDLCHELGIACVWGIGGGERDVYDAQVLESLRVGEV